MENADEQCFLFQFGKHEQWAKKQLFLRRVWKEDILTAFKVKGWNAETKNALSPESDEPSSFGTFAIVC